MECAKIIQIFNSLESDRNVVEGTWDLIEKFIAPLRGGQFFQKQPDEGSIDWRRGRDVFDNTGILASDILSSSIHGALTNPATQWFDLGFKNYELSTDAEAKVWLESATDVMHQSIQGSNFNLEVAELYADLVSFGNGVMLEEDDGTGSLEFSAVPLREAFFTMNHKGGARCFFRRLEWTLSQIVDKFGVENLPEDLKLKWSAASGSAPSSKETIVYCVYERDKYRDGIAPAKRRKYGVKYVLRRTQEMLGTEGGYYEMPAYIVRWKKASGSQWGYGPGTLALSDVLTLNRLIELVLKATEKVVDPTTLATERSILGTLDLTAGGLSIVRNIDGIKAYESGARFDVSALQVDRLQSKINRTFLVDQLQLKESPMMTATEVQVRYEMMQRLLGPTLGRIVVDLLDPMITRTFMILLRAGKIPPPPEHLRQTGADLQIEYLGPLARAQHVDRVGSIERWAAQIGNFAAVMPEVMDVPNPTRMVRETARLLGVPQAVLNTEAESKKLSDERKKQQAQQQQLMMAQSASESMKNAAAGAASLQGGGANVPA